MLRDESFVVMQVPFPTPSPIESKTSTSRTRHKTKGLIEPLMEKMNEVFIIS